VLSGRVLLSCTKCWNSTVFFHQVWRACVWCVLWCVVVFCVVTKMCFVRCDGEWIKNAEEFYKYVNNKFIVTYYILYIFCTHMLSLQFFCRVGRSVKKSAESTLRNFKHGRLCAAWKFRKNAARSQVTCWNRLGRKPAAIFLPMSTIYTQGSVRARWGSCAAMSKSQGWGHDTARQDTSACCT